MSDQVFANLVARMDLDSARFQRELNTTSKQTARFEHRAKAANDATGRFSKGLKQAANSAAFVTGPLGGVSSRLNIVANGMTTVGAAGLVMAGTLTAITVAAAQSVKVFSEYEQGQLKTDAIIASTGSSAGRTAQQIEDLSASIALSTLASVEGARNAAQVMLSFKSVQTSVFDDALATTQDMAAVFGGDMASNAKMLGKALEDPIKGINAMTRAGVSFTDSEKKKIKAMVEAGNVAQAQGAILSALAGQIGGAGSAAAGGVAGSVDTLAQRWDELMLAIAKTTSTGNGATAFFNTLAAGIDATTKAIDPAPAIKMNELLSEKIRLDQKLIVLAARKNQNDDRLKIITAQTEKELSIVKNQMRVIQDARFKADKAETDAIKAADEAKKTRETNRLSDLLAQQQANGAKTLASLDSQLATETQKIQIEYEARNAAIEEMVLTKVSLEKAGFESVESLRQHYLNLSNVHHQTELAQLRETAQLKEDAIAKQKSDEAAASAEKLAGLKSEQEQFVAEMLYQEQLLQQVKSGAISSAEAHEHEALQSKLVTMQENFDQQLLLVANNEAAKKELIDSFTQGNEIAVTQSEKRISDLKAAENRARTQDTATSFAANLAALSASSKKGAAIAKVAAITQATIKTYESATSAYSSLAGIPYIGPALGVAAASAAIGAGLANVSAIRSQSIAGMAHNGISSIPNEGTWLLDKGERVYTNESAKQLDQMYKTTVGGQSSGNHINVNFNVTAGDANGFDGWWSANEKPVLRRIKSYLDTNE